MIGQRGDGGSALTEDTATDPMKVMTVHLHEDNPHDQYVLNEEALRTFTFAAYAGLTQSTSGVAYPDLGAGWNTVNTLDAITVPDHYATASIANNSITVQYNGVYLLIVYLSFTHNEMNSGRHIRVRLFNVTDGVPAGDGTVVGTGRNVGVTTVSVAVLVSVPEDNVEYQIQFGGGDSYASVVMDTAMFSMNSVGLYYGDLSTNAEPVGGMGRGKGRGRGLGHGQS